MALKIVVFLDDGCSKGESVQIAKELRCLYRHR